MQIFWRKSVLSHFLPQADKLHTAAIWNAQNGCKRASRVRVRVGCAPVTLVQGSGAPHPFRLYLKGISLTPQNETAAAFEGKVLFFFFFYSRTHIYVYNSIFSPLKKQKKKNEKVPYI